MLNFREELGKTIEKKREEAINAAEEKNKLADGFLIDFIDKLNKKQLYEFSAPLKFLFGFGGDTVYIKEFNKAGELTNNIILKKYYNGYSEAYIILQLLEKKLISEGYEIVDNTSAKEGSFHVIINVNA